MKTFIDCCCFFFNQLLRLQACLAHDLQWLTKLMVEARLQVMIEILTYCTSADEVVWRQKVYMHVWSWWILTKHCVEVFWMVGFFCVYFGGCCSSWLAISVHVELLLHHKSHIPLSWPWLCWERSVLKYVILILSLMNKNVVQTLFIRFVCFCKSVPARGVSARCSSV